MASEFVETFSPYQKIFDGKVFPKILRPSTSQGASLGNKFQNLKKSKPFLEQQLQEFGAVLLRGFPLECAADFDTLLEAIGWEEARYAGVATRKHVIGRVYTASDVDRELEIPFHHEMTQVKSGPAPKIIFFCDIEPASGGQTPILLSYKVEEKMREEFPDFVKKIEEGVYYIKTLPASTNPSARIGIKWQSVYGTDEPAEAEKRAEEWFTERLVWLPDGRVNVIGGPYEPIKVLDKKRDRKIWLNYIASTPLPKNRDNDGYWDEERSESIDDIISNDGFYKVVCKDGTRLPKNILARCKEIHEEFCVDIPWQKGDVMILDNLAVVHARRACDHPRKILVALCGY